MAGKSSPPKWLLVIAVALALFGWLIWDQKRTDADNKRTYEAALTVAILPDGVEAAWLDYVDRRISATIHREKNFIRIVGDLDHILGQTNLVSTNAPYSITCNLLTGGSIHFAKSGDDSISVTLFGILANANSTAEKAPALRVHPYSVAGRALAEKLCGRIAERMSEIMDSPPQR